MRAPCRLIEPVRLGVSTLTRGAVAAAPAWAAKLALAATATSAGVWRRAIVAAAAAAWAAACCR